MEAYFEREVKPYVPEAWIDESYTDDRDGRVGRVGYEIKPTAPVIQRSGPTRR